MSAVDYSYGTGVFMKPPSVFLAGYAEELDVAARMCRETANTGESFRILLVSYPGNGKFTFALRLADVVERLDPRYRSGLLKVPLVGGRSEEAVAAAEKGIRGLKAALARHDGPFLLIVKGASPAFASLIPDVVTSSSRDARDQGESGDGIGPSQSEDPIAKRALDIREQTSAWLKAQLDEVGKPRVLLFLSDLRQPLPAQVLDMLEVPLYLPMPTADQASALFGRALMDERFGEAVAAEFFEIGEKKRVQYTGQDLSDAAVVLMDDLAEFNGQGPRDIAAHLAKNNVGVRRSEIEKYEAAIKLLRDRSNLILRRWRSPTSLVGAAGGG